MVFVGIFVFCCFFGIFEIMCKYKRIWFVVMGREKKNVIYEILVDFKLLFYDLSYEIYEY